MATQYPTSLDSIALPVFTGGAPAAALGQAGRTAESLITDLRDSIQAVQAAVGTLSAPGPLMGNTNVQGINVRSEQFGAVGDGVADDSAAILTAVSTAIQLGADVFAPAGFYKLNTAATAAVNSPRFALRGAGVGLTVFIVPASNTAGGILIDSPGNPHDAEVTLSDFSVVTQGVGQGTGIKVAMSPGGAEHSRSVRIDRVHVHGEDPDTDCFAIGIDLTATWRPSLVDVIIGGPFGSVVDQNQTDASPLYTSDIGLKLDDAYAWNVERTYIWSAFTAISDVGSTAEGGRLTNSHMVGVRNGLNRFRTNPEPGLRITGCHVNYRDTGIKIDGGKVQWIDHCHIYNQDDTNEYTAIARDIWLCNTEFTNVHDNYFWFPGPADRINIHVDANAHGSSPALGRFVDIHHNFFGSGGTNAVLITATAEDIEVRDNPTRALYVKAVQDNSGNAVITSSTNGVHRLENQGNGSVHGPDFELYRDSDSPAVADNLGRLSFKANNSGGTVTEYGAVQSQILDPVEVGESGTLDMLAAVSGTMTKLGSFRDVGATNSTSLFLLTKRGSTVSLQRVTLGTLGPDGYPLVVAGP